MRTLCSSTLIGEFFVIGFAALVAMKDPDLSMATVWTVSGTAMVAAARRMTSVVSMRRAAAPR